MLWTAVSQVEPTILPSWVSSSDHDATATDTGLLLILILQLSDAADTDAAVVWYCNWWDCATIDTDAAFGTDVYLFNLKFRTVLNVTNLLDKKYYDHLSLLKPLGVLDMGRNISL